MGHITTIFPQNLAVEKFNFEVLFYVVIIQRWLDGIYTLDLTSAYNLFMCRTLQRRIGYNWQLPSCICFVYQPFNMWCYFEGGIYWDPSTEMSGVISRMAILQVAERFQGNTVSENTSYQNLKYTY